MQQNFQVYFADIRESRHHLGNPCVDEGSIKYVLEKIRMGILTGFFWFWIGTGAEFS
jgi:hypothetical protein